VSKPNILFQPAPGVQTDFLKCSAFEKLMAGGAGAGKSLCLLADAAASSANPAMRSLILRVSYPMLKDLIAASHLIYGPMRARYNVTQHQWVFPSGAIVEFGAIENTEAAIMNYSGRSFSYIGVDEIVQLPGDTIDASGQAINGAYSFLKSRLRAVEGSGLEKSLQLASTGTPGGIGQSWIRSYFGIKQSQQSCETRDPITGTRRAFFHCSVADNPYLAGTSYAARLEGLPPAQMKALRYGDFDSYVGQIFAEWNPRIHLCEPFPLPATWLKWRAADDGFAAPFACLWLAWDRDGTDTIYVCHELYQRELTPAAVAEKIKVIDDYLTGEPWRCHRLSGFCADWRGCR
jgi:Terminase large subunit, T4likevirus-type, N-terminal